MEKISATTRFLEDAIKGEWKYKGHEPYFARQGFWAVNVVISAGAEGGRMLSQMSHKILLDPLAWQATVKSQLSKSDFEGLEEGTQEQFIKDIARTKMHRFIDHLADGLPIEEALNKLV